MATQEELKGLVSVIYELGLKPEIRSVLGADNETFDALLVETDPSKAYNVAQVAGDKPLAQKAAEALIKQRLRGTSLEEAVLGVYAPVQTNDAHVPVNATHAGFSIESLKDRYRVNGVPYQGEVCTVDISKELLDNGASHTQSDWIEVTKQGEWKLPSGPLYFAVLTALYDNKESSSAPVEELQKMFANDLRQYFMMTSTRIRYAHKGLDTVVHDVGYAVERAEQTNIVGPDGYINETSGFGAEMKVLVGTDDCQKVESVGHWITGKKSYLYRFNSKPKEDTERALVLDRNGGRFGIYASGNIDVSGPARGVVVRGAENSP